MSCGLPLVLGRASDSLLFTKLLPQWLLPSAWLSLSFTGCDTVSAFAGRGKKTAWDTWKSFPEVTDALQELLAMPSEVTRSQIERFVVLMYDRTSECMEVNDARKHLFSQKSRTLENIPPTQAALKEHIKRTCFQANLWNQSLVLDPEIPEPSDWGWTKESTGWQPFWTALPEAARSCHEQIRCNCQKGLLDGARVSKLLLHVQISVYVRETVLGFSHSSSQSPGKCKGTRVQRETGGAEGNRCMGQGPRTP